jgi:hypothetical protein
VRYTLIALSIVLVGAGLTRPEFAGRGAQMLVACAAIAIVATLAREQWGDLEPQTVGPFVFPDTAGAPRVETSDVAELVRSIEGSDGHIPAPIVEHIAEACRGRLIDHHRLHLDNEADHDGIESIVSAQMWTVLTTERDDAVDVSIRALPQLLSEVETL